MVLQTYGLNVNNDDEGDNSLSRVSEDHVKRGHNSSSGHLVAMSPFPGDYAPNHYYTDLDAVNYLSQGNKELREGGPKLKGTFKLYLASRCAISHCESTTLNKEYLL